MEKQIEPYMLNNRPKCLLIGNGINRYFKEQSWEEMIKEELSVSEQDCSFEDIKNMPSTMQIVVATRDQVDVRMKYLSDHLMNLNMTAEKIAFLQGLENLPVDDILTTNYSFELEATCGMQLRKTTYSASLKSSFELENKDKRLRLFQYYETPNQKRIWHIHGDVAKPDTMLMGHYYYAKQLRAVQDCVAKSVRRYQYCQKENLPFAAYSWIDQFLVGDVYILGLGMYMCETDLWYLACCKKRNFPDTKIYFYDLEIKEISQRKLMEAYNIQIVEGKKIGAISYETNYYQTALADMRRRMSNQ